MKEIVSCPPQNTNSAFYWLSSSTILNRTGLQHVHGLAWTWGETLSRAYEHHAAHNSRLSVRFHDKKGFLWPQITWEPAEFANLIFVPRDMMRLLGKQAGFWSVFPTLGFLLGAIKWQVKCGGGWAMHSTMFCLLPHCDNLCFAGTFCENEGRKHML